MRYVATEESTDGFSNLWANYWKERSEAARNALMERYFHLLKFAAAHLYRRYGRRVEVDDLVQYGVLGLKDAINRFDPARGVKFEAYCSTRIRGAMLDGLKSQQWLSRDQRERITRFLKAQQSILMETGLPPEDEQIAGRIGVCPTTIRRLERESIGVNPLSLFTQCHGTNEGHEADHAETLVDRREETAVDQLQRKDVKALFLRELTRSERLVLMLYYYENMTMREIGEALGIHETRVSKIHADIIQRLREQLGRRMIERGGHLAASYRYPNVV